MKTYKFDSAGLVPLNAKKVGSSPRNVGENVFRRTFRNTEYEMEIEPEVFPSSMFHNGAWKDIEVAMLATSSMYRNELQPVMLSPLEMVISREKYNALKQGKKFEYGKWHDRGVSFSIRVMEREEVPLGNGSNDYYAPTVNIVDIYG